MFSSALNPILSTPIKQHYHPQQREPSPPSVNKTKFIKFYENISTHQNYDYLYTLCTMVQFKF